MKKCTKPNIIAEVIINVPLNENYEPFINRSIVETQDARLEYYHCTNCLEQFSTIEEVKEHKGVK